MSAELDLAGLWKKAVTATPGPWKVVSDSRHYGILPSSLATGPIGNYIRVVETHENQYDGVRHDDAGGIERVCDAEFIAAWNPATALAVLRRLEAAERERDAALADARNADAAWSRTKTEWAFEKARADAAEAVIARVRALRPFYASSSRMDSNDWRVIDADELAEALKGPPSPPSANTGDYREAGGILQGIAPDKPANPWGELTPERVRDIRAAIEDVAAVLRGMLPEDGA